MAKSQFRSSSSIIKTSRPASMMMTISYLWLTTHGTFKAMLTLTKDMSMAGLMKKLLVRNTNQSKNWMPC